MTHNINKYKILIGGKVYFELSNGSIYTATVKNVTWNVQLNCLQYHCITEFGNTLKLTENEIKLIVF